MGRISEVNVGMNDIVTYKCNSAVTDNDVNKPVKLLSADLVELCSDGDGIYGWIDSVETHTEDGKTVVGVQVNGRRWATLSGSSAFGALVEAAANEAVSVALATKWALVSTQAVIAATLAVNLANDANGTLIAANVNATAVAVNALMARVAAPRQQWKIIYGTTYADGTHVLLERQ